MLVNIKQYDFTHGELSPKLIAKTDLKIYKKCAQRIRNMVITPEGGAKRRFGSDFVNQINVSDNQYMLGYFNFSDAKKYLLVWQHLKVDVYLDGVFKVSVVTPYPGTILEGLEIKWSQSHNALRVVHPDYAPRILIKGADDVTWTFNTVVFKNLPSYDFLQNYDAIDFTLSDVKVGSGLTLTASAALFDANYVGGIFIGIGEALSLEDGVARITGFTSTTVVTVDIISTFADSFSSGVSGKNVFLGQPIWSDPKGWPTTVTFYEGRCIYGGCKSLPATIVMSVSSDFDNFDIGRGRPADAIQVDIAEDTEIKHVIGDRSFQIFTTFAEYAAPQIDGRPLEPANISIRKQSGNGSENIEPMILDNQTFYVKKGGKGVMSYEFDYNANGYHSTNISIISSHLINFPINGAVLQGARLEDANYLFLINEDGNLAVYQTLKDEAVSAWTLSSTECGVDGTFERITSVGDEIYFIVKRTINDLPVYYLEKLDFNSFTDSAFKYTYGSPTNVITGLDHLESEEVRVIADGYVLPNKTVHGGEITIEIEATTVEVGLIWNPLLRPLPPNTILKTGPTDYCKRRISDIYIDYYESAGIYVENKIIPVRKFNEEFDYPPVDPQSGFQEINILDDWEPRQTFDITQRDPLPMTILAIGYRINFSES